MEQKQTDRILKGVVTLRKDPDWLLPSVTNQKYHRLCDGRPISVITIHLWVSVYRSEIDGGIDGLVYLRQPVIPSAGSIIDFW
jgi:hypothetical protein